MDRTRTFLLPLMFLSAFFLFISCPNPVELPGSRPEPTPGAIRIGSFNLQIFGPTKAANPAVMEAYARIIRTDDVIAVQEIRDASGDAIVSLKNKVNETGRKYELVLGSRLGQSMSRGSG